MNSTSHNLAVNPTPNTQLPNTLSRGQRVLLTLALALALWLPRGLELARFVAVDERSWVTRGGNFYLALTTGDFASTYQYYHPGVTTMWIGALAYLWHYPDYPTDATGQIRDMSEGIEDRLVAQGHDPMQILATARSIMVVVTVVLLLVAFWLAVDLFGLLPALVGMLLLGFDPLTLGLTRMLHVDGLSSTLMFVSTLALLRFCAPNPAHTGRWRDLILSGVMAGLAWLTKSPALVLGPLALLIVGIEALRETQRETLRVRRAVRVLAVWGAVALLVFVLLWPAMWVQPVASVQSIFGAAGEFAEESNQQIFFNGEIITDDPGALFYPITYLWHVTPITLVGLMLALVAGVVALRTRSYTGESGGMLLLYVLLFTMMMTFGSKKIDRYLLPAYLPLALLAGLGWSALAGAIAGRGSSPLAPASDHASFRAQGAPERGIPFWRGSAKGDSSSQTPRNDASKKQKLSLRVLHRLALFLSLRGGAAPGYTRNDVTSPRSRSARWGLWLLPLVLAAQIALVLPHFPYYFTFYNPLLGGNARAPEVLMIGLGEGIDEAARYLNAQPDAEQLSVASWYRGGSFNYIFRGHDLNLDEYFEADYAVLYVHQWQRQVPSALMLNYFAQLTPAYTATLQGLDYAWVYDLRDAPTPTYFTDWAGAIRLTQTEVPATPLQPGDRFLVNFHLHTTGTLDTNLVAIVRVVDAAGNEVARDENWPYGAATSTWRPGEDYIDGHELTLPADLPADLPEDLPGGYLRVELGFYDGDAQTLVTPMVAGTTTARGDFVPVGYLQVGPAEQPARLESPPILGAQVKLLGVRVQDAALRGDGVPVIEAQPTQPLTLPLTLAWQPTRPLDTDYVTLIHLIAPDGTLAQQYDRAPLHGVAPTTLWRTGDTLLDAYELEVPAGLPSGDYDLLVGLYDLPTLTRLPVQINGKAAGDTIHVATITVP